jgi:acetylornithine deacetylase/succinyl-diaminopimelate desuccinylase-like protein
MKDWTLEQQISICEIPAPPFKEAARAAEFARRLTEIGLRNVRIDAEGNVIGEYPGVADDRVVALAAHLDTVFPEGTDVTVKRSGDTLRAPGIGDNCRGLTVLLSVARTLQESGVQPGKTILFVGTVGEEGPGNLRGVRHLFDSELGPRIEYFVAVDNAGAELATRAVGSNRYRVRFIGPGGHSYGAFGMPNPAHALGRAVARIADIQIPERPKATFNVGVIGGGTSVNSIAAEAWFEMDLRSESPGVLAALDTAFNRAVHGAVAAERARWPRSTVPLEVKIDTIGIRPAGSQPDTSAIVNLAITSARVLGFMPRIEASSTDANIPLSRGIPAIRISGGGIGRDSHSLNEYYIDGEHPYLGPQWALMIVLTLSGVM